MRGTTLRREQSMANLVLAPMVHAMRLQAVPHHLAATPKVKEYRRR